MTTVECRCCENEATLSDGLCDECSARLEPLRMATTDDLWAAIALRSEAAVLILRMNEDHREGDSVFKDRKEGDALKILAMLDVVYTTLKDEFRDYSRERRNEQEEDED